MVTRRHPLTDYLNRLLESFVISSRVSKSARFLNPSLATAIYGMQRERGARCFQVSHYTSAFFREVHLLITWCVSLPVNRRQAKRAGENVRERGEEREERKQEAASSEITVPTVNIPSSPHV